MSTCWHNSSEAVTDFDAPTRLMLILNAYDTKCSFCCLMKTNLLYLKNVYEEAKLSQDAGMLHRAWLEG